MVDIVIPGNDLVSFTESFHEGRKSMERRGHKLPAAIRAAILINYGGQSVGFGPAEVTLDDGSTAMVGVFGTVPHRVKVALKPDVAVAEAGPSDFVVSAWTEPQPSLDRLCAEVRAREGMPATVEPDMETLRKTLGEGRLSVRLAARKAGMSIDDLGDAFTALGLEKPFDL